MNMLSKTIAGIFVLLATAFTAAHGQSSGLPSGVSQPVFHINETSGFNSAPWGGISQLNDISGNGRHLYSNSSTLPQVKYDANGNRYIEMYSADMYTTASEVSFYDGDLFIVAEGSSFFNYTSGAIEIVDYGGSQLKVGAWTIPNQKLTGLTNIQITSQNGGSVKVLQNEQSLLSSNASYQRISTNIRLGGTAKIYEIILFQNLTIKQRQLVTQYLMDKYGLAPFSKQGLTMWLRADKDVTPWPSDKVVNYMFEQANRRFFGNYMEDTIYFDEYAANGLPALRVATNYGFMCNEGGNGSEYLINGRDLEYFAVLKDTGGNVTSVLLDFGGYKKTYLSANKGTLTEQIGNGPAIDFAVPANLSLNNWRIYNVSIGGGYQSTYLNKTRLYHQPYASTENISIREFFLGVRDPQYPFRGYLSELIIYNRKLTDAERESVKNYLMSKYNLN